MHIAAAQSMRKIPAMADNEPRGIKARGVHKLADKQVADSGKSTGCNGYYRVHPSPMR